MARRTAAGRSGRARTLVVLAVALSVVAALVVGVVLVVRWWTGPDLFRDDGARMVAAPKPVKRAQLHVAVTYPSVKPREPVTLTFRDVEPHFSANTAGAEATVWLCREKSSLGAAGGRLGKHCPDAVPIERGTRMTFSSEPDSDHVVVTIRPTRPGEARLDRVDLDYALGAGNLYRRGTDHVDVDVTVQAR